MPGDSLHDALSEAFQNFDEEETDEREPGKPDSDPEPGAKSDPDPGTERPEGGSGSESPEGKATPEKKPEVTGDPKEQKQLNLDDKKEEEVKPPQSWSPAAREKFKELPKEVQQEALKRESEVTKALQTSADARKQVEQFGKVLSPYQGMFTSMGVDPLTGTNNVLQMAAMLQGGTPQQKVQVVDHLIRNFGVDLKMLDGSLSGNLQKKSDPQYEHLQKQLQEQQRFINEFQQQRQSEQQQHQQQVGSEVEQFIQSHEFASDLRMVMADFMDIAEKQGQKIDLETAYARALSTRPDLQQLLNNRQSREKNQQSVEKARQAGVSMPQVNAPSEAPKQPETMRDAIMMAMENG